MINNKNSEYAVLSVFPSVETFHEFKRDSENQSAITSFVNFAFEQKMIKRPDEAAFILFVENKGQKISKLSPPEGLTFEKLFKEKEEMLGITISGRALTQRVNTLIARMKIDLPKLTNTMLTRLKKEPVDTPHKKKSLKTLAFWLGYERPDLEVFWNFEALCKLCYASQPVRKINDGVRIGLTLFSRGDVISQEAMVWLKKNIKNHIQSSINILPYGGWGTVKSYDITTVYIDFPKEGQANYPSSYQASIRNAISVAHQISIRWALSDFCTKNRFLSIGIATGEFANLNHQLLPILNAKLPGDPVIRMTDYTHQCIKVGDIRTIFYQTSKEITLFNTETLSVWWVVGLWSFIYWDFIPRLLKEEILLPTPASISKLNQFFMYPERIEANQAPNAIQKFFLFPQNSLLGIEIAKTLYYRRSFGESSEVLWMVLRIDPLNVSARSLRMMIYRNLSVEEPSFSISQIHFDRAKEEAQFILANCKTLEEDFFCEYAVVYLSRAVSLLRRMREQKDLGPDPLDEGQLKDQVFGYLEKACGLFERGIVVSPSRHRSVYLLICTQVLKQILETEPGFFAHPALPISVPKSIYRQKAFDLLSSFNYFRWRDLHHTDYQFLEQILLQTFDRHDGSGTLRAYRPTLCFCFSVMLWDMFPKRTVNCAKTVLQYLYAAVSMAQELEEQNLYIYSYTRCLGEMLLPKTFIAHIRKAIGKVEACAGTLETLEDMAPSQMIEDNEKEVTLFTINI